MVLKVGRKFKAQTVIEVFAERFPKRGSSNQYKIQQWNGDYCKGSWGRTGKVHGKKSASKKGSKTDREMVKGI